MSAMNDPRADDFLRGACPYGGRHWFTANVGQRVTRCQRCGTPNKSLSGEALAEAEAFERAYPKGAERRRQLYERTVERYGEPA